MRHCERPPQDVELEHRQGASDSRRGADLSDFLASINPHSADLVDSCRPWIDPYATDNAELLLSVHSFVVETPSNCIVVDTCIGREDLMLSGDPAFGERLEDALPGGLPAVDVVVCTHLHFDHIGWNTVERDGVLEPRFANARYLVTGAELDAQRDAEDTNAYNTSIAPLIDAGCLDRVAPDHRIDDWVALEPSPGHTPGHVSVRIVDGTGDNDASAVITGDLAHSPLQLAYPDASSSSDDNPALAITTRKDFIQDVANTKTLVLGTHFPPPTAGYITQRDGKTRFD